ncbi:nucleotide exchange factor GrpE [Ornithinimicrobium faecis]|uniref:Protein GrpE n=1 Tax=Ornithinimicrobium faecis TaxID=2934158 RepID=A0ABY4YT05_9MICO|nr:nucleotide exchange factor GrpE [Ornithinimicrobium sp. HY1793]USQ79712.1 nucleotide exchange factor GrpE [Ornithinimicrobium sp. HY1793]
MTETTGAGGPQDFESEGPTGPVIRDKRRLDPETGEVRRPAAEAEAVAPEGVDPENVGPETGDEVVDGEVLAEGDDAFAGDVGESLPGGTTDSEAHPDTQLASDRLEDLRRLQAEYVNYKRRVDRDRVRDREAGTTAVVESLLPVLDDLHMAREHGELTEGPLLAIADKLETTLGKFGVERLGAVGEVFDPAVHEALMHLPEADLPEGATETTIVQVMQPGFKVGDRVVRAARVAVADPA